MERSDRAALAAAAVKKVWARARNRVGLSSFTPRLLLFPLLVVVQLTASFFSGAGFLIASPPTFMLSGAFLWLVWFAGLFLLGRSSTDKLSVNATARLRTASLAALALLALVSVAEVTLFQTGVANKSSSVLVTGLHRVFVYNDGTALSHQATNNFIAGENPYLSANILTAMQEFNGGSDKITPRRKGTLANVFPYPTPAELSSVWQKALTDPSHPPPEIETRLNYPAGVFELPALFIMLGIPDIRLVYLIYVIAGLIAVVLLAPKRFRLPLIAMMVLSVAVWNAIASGETGSLAFPFMLLGWVLVRENPWASAAFMGIAVTAKQTAWFLMPFYVILIFKTFGFRRTMYLGGIVAGVFLASNAPFILRSPMLWMQSLGAPMSDDFFPLGVGLVTLVTSGILVIKSSLIFSVMEGLVFVGGAIWYFRNCRRFPHVGPVLAILPLFFAWRSLWPYFFYIDIIVLSAVIIDEYGLRLAESKKSVAAVATAKRR